MYITPTVTSWSNGSPVRPSNKMHCTVRPHWTQVNAAMRGVLAQVPLTQLVKEMQ